MYEKEERILSKHILYEFIPVKESVPKKKCQNRSWMIKVLRNMYDRSEMCRIQIGVEGNKGTLTHFYTYTNFMHEC